MKSVVLFIILLYSMNVFAQKSKPQSKYVYEYKFTLDPFKDTTQLAIDTLQKKDSLVTLSGTIYNYYRKAMAFSNVVLKGVNGEKRVMADTGGHFEIKAQPGTYTIIFLMQMQEFKQPLNITGDRDLHFNIRFERGRSRDIFVIHSMKKLSPRKIAGIKQCVQSNDGKTKGCEKKGEYFIMYEI